MICKLNLVGNAINLGSVAVDVLTTWMYPQLSALKYPGDSLLRFSNTVSNDEMYKPDLKTKDQNPIIMVLKNGNSINLTVGRLNTIRAFTRTFFEGKPGTMSKEIAAPRQAPSQPRVTGSGVIDAKGRVCELLTGGDGDCTFLTSVKPLDEHGICVNIFPVPAEM